LNLELGGTMAGVNYDQIAITGLAVLRGSLVVTLVDGFRPAHGDRFEVLSFDSSQGFFDSILGLDLGDGLFLEPEFNSDNLVLETVDTRPRAFFGRVRRAPDGDLTLPVNNVAGQDVVIEATPNLVDPVWIPIQTNLISGAVWGFAESPTEEFPNVSSELDDCPSVASLNWLGLRRVFVPAPFVAGRFNPV